MPFTWNNRLRSLAWGRVGISFLLAAVLSALAVLVIHMVRDPQTFAIINARSEVLSYNVFNPELAIIYGSGLKISSWPDDRGVSRDGQCVGGAIIPDVMSTVTYQRIEKSVIQISIDGKGEHRSDQNSVAGFDGELVLYMDAECGDLVSNRFPIWGPGKIGSAFAMRSDGPGPILLSGSLDVFGRTIDLGPFRGGAMYPATQPLTIPSGGYIESHRPGDGGQSSNVAAEDTALFGYVSLSDEDGLGVHVTTETPELQISTPGVKENTNRIEIGLFAQVLNDPNILAIQLTLVLLALLWPISMSVVSLSLSRPELESQNDDPPSIELNSTPLDIDPPVQSDLDKNG
ncbi:hypothetical protein [Mesorhizobium sp. A556]